MDYESVYYEPASNEYPEFDRFEIAALIEAYENAIDSTTGLIGNYSRLNEALGTRIADKDLNAALGSGANKEIDWLTFLKIQRWLYPQKKVAFDRDFLEPAMKNFPQFSRAELLAAAAAFRNFDEDGRYERERERFCVCFFFQSLFRW
jgi:hypothetical protein